MRRAAPILLLLAAATGILSVAGAWGGTDGQSQPAPFPGPLDEHQAIQYAARQPADRMARLARALAEGTVALPFSDRSGYLRPVLAALGIAAESQILVFSKTGIQRAVTGPDTPRALYFDESVVVGYIAGSRLLELAAHDAQQGVTFYTIDQAAPSPAIVRQTTCLRCHVSSNTLEVPGLLNRSMFTSPDGEVMPRLGSHDVSHRTPFPHRWGGMYVTSTLRRPPYSSGAHMGNITVSAHDRSRPLVTSDEAFRRWLESEPQARGYPSADSDIVTLMLFDHQTHAVNLLTRLNWETRVAALESRVEFERGVLRALAEELADYLLFVDEAPLPAPLTPPPGLSEWFTARGPRDRQGRSLRELDLVTRLLKYPCSYMIYTEAFGGLPPAAKLAVYRRMWAILSGADSAAKYSHLSAASRRVVLEILGETKGDLPGFFR